MRASRFLAPVVAILLAPAPLARAEILGMGNEAVAVQADRLDIDILAGDATLTGKVTFSRGDLTVSCPRIDLRFDHAPHVTWARVPAALQQTSAACTPRHPPSNSTSRSKCSTSAGA